MKNLGFLRLLFVAGCFAFVELLCRTGVIPHTVMIAPSEMALAAAGIVQSGRYNADILLSLLEVAGAAFGAIVGGFFIGVVLHANPGVRRAVQPLLSSYYAIPSFIFYPFFIVLLGAGPAPIIAIACLLGIVAMITATINGLDRIPRALRKTAQVMRLSPLNTALRVLLPAALPYVFSGIKLAIAYAFIGVIASEFILSGQGIGYQIAYAYNNFQNTDMYGLMFIILLLVIVINSILNRIDSRYQARRG